MTVATSILLLLAISALQLSRAAQGSAVAALTTGAMLFAGLLAARFVLLRLLRRAEPRLRNRVALASGIVGCGLLVAGSSISLASFAGEEMVLAVLLTLAGVLFVCFDDPMAPRRAALVSVVVVLFALPGLSAAHRLPVIVATAVCACAWLATSVNGATAGTWARVYAGLAAVMIGGVCLLADHRIQPTDGNPWYAAWVPTSGGDGAGDTNARRGTGDGPDEINGGADALGFDKSDTFSESGRDGLYDLWVESYGKPAKPSDQQRMVGLKPQDVKVVHGNDRENLRVGRSFELRREPQPHKPSAGDVGAAARAWIKGPMPAYVPLAVFRDYDGAAWQVMDPGKPSIPARKMDANWMEILHRPISLAFAGTDHYEIRAGDLGGDVLPLPPIVERFRMGRVSRPDFFATTRSGLIRLARRTLPAGATVDVVAKRVAPARLVNVEPALPKHSDPSVLDVSLVDAGVLPLAVEWGGGRERGWRQIEQVLQRLRGHVALDQAAVVSASGEPVRELLFASRRGPDHQIASAAVMLLRSLGYPTRLVSGFYASDDDVDPRSGFVPLSADDVHFWIEVRLADGTWITVDPTPGYPMLNLPTPPGEWLAGVWRDARLAIAANPLAAALTLVAATLFIISRRRWIDLFATLSCRLRGYPPRHVLRVLERRARIARRERPASMPPGKWVASLGAGPAGASFVAVLNRSLYRERTDAPADNAAAKAALVAIKLRTLMNERNGNA